MPVTPSKGPRPNLGEQAASASKLIDRKTGTDPRRIRSAKASRTSEVSLDPENSAVSEKPVANFRELLKNKNAPTTSSSVEATTKRSNNPTKLSAQPAKKKTDSEAAVSRAISTLLDRFLHDTHGERHNYVFEVVVAKGAPLIHKIGMAKDPIARQAQLESRCKFAQMSEVPASVKERPSKAARMVEKLIHLELQMFKCPGKCTCGAAHREYFSVSKTIALEAHQRWADFCKKEPWGPDNKLLPFWEDRLKTKPAIADNYGYAGLAASWEEFTRPSNVDRENWNHNVRIKFLVSQWIYAFALIEAFIIAFFLPSAYSVILSIVMSYYVAWESSRAWTTHEALFIEVPKEQQEVLVNRVDGKNMIEGLGEKSKTDPPVEVIDLTVDGEEGRGSVPVRKDGDQVKVAELSREKIRGGPTNPWDHSDDDGGAGDSAMASDNDSDDDEEDERHEDEDEEMEDRDDGDEMVGDEMDCDERDSTTDDGMLSHVMGAVNLTGSSNLKAAMPTLLGDSPGARLSSRPVLVQA